MKKFSVFLWTISLVLTAFFLVSAIPSVGHAYSISYDEVLCQDGDAGSDPNTLSAEPTILLFFGSALLGLAELRRRFRKR